MAAVSMSPMLDSSLNVDKLTYEIFSMLENKFLFGYDDTKLSLPENHQIPAEETKSAKNLAGKVRILSIDGGGATDGILAAKSLAHLESCLRRKTGIPNARVADYFDVVSGSGTGGVLAALLFTRGRDGGPISTADEALNFLKKLRLQANRSSPPGIFRKLFHRSKVEKIFRKTFGDCTLKDTLKSVLIPCYDLSSRAPFLFSRADAMEMDGYDFKMSDVCLATSADPTVVGAVEMRSVDKRTKIVAVEGGIAMNNPTAAAVTHVLNNKQEFPMCRSVEDLLVVSLGNGESDFGAQNLTSSPACYAKIAGEGASDMVDQAISMAFGDCRTRNYVRVQANLNITQKQYCKSNKRSDVLALSEEMLSQKNVESVLFQGKKMATSTNFEKLEAFAEELMKEQERRKTSILPTVLLKHTSPSPRTSSATTTSSLSSC